MRHFNPAFLIALAFPLGMVYAQQSPPPQQSQQPAHVASADATQTSIEARLGVYVFPTKGQGSEQRRTDESHCYEWAKAQTQFDPINAPTQVQAAQVTPSAQTQESGHAVRGAAAGAAIGAIAGNAGAGAAAGATAGLLRGANRRRQAQEEYAQQSAQAQQQAAQANQQLAHQQNAFKKAFGACLEGVGYTVK